MTRSAFAALLSFALCAAAPGAGARTPAGIGGDAEWRAPTRAFTLASGGISLDQAVQMAQSRYRARVVRADTATEGGRVIYRLRLLSADGRVFSVRVDAQTGQFD